MMQKNKSVNTHNFAMIPRADIPRSSFRIQSTHKTTFNGGDLVPIYVDEVLPGDTLNLILQCLLPMFAQLGEQTVLLEEIYATGMAGDKSVFGYQERWAEYRYRPTQISGQFKSTTAGPLDYWHYAEKFAN